MVSSFGWTPACLPLSFLGHLVSRPYGGPLAFVGLHYRDVASAEEPRFLVFLAYTTLLVTWKARFRAVGSFEVILLRGYTELFFELLGCNVLGHAQYYV